MAATGRALAALAALATCASCVVLARPVEVPEGDAPAVLLLTTRLGGPMKRIARHPWLALRGAGEPEWEKWEVLAGGHDTVQRHTSSQPLAPAFGDGVRLHGVWRGGEAQRMIDCVRREGPRYPDRYTYWVWPGPNSNTFIDWVMRRCGIHANLPSTSVGKDHRGWVGASWTTGGTGFQIETPLVGFRLGLTEGIAIHLFGLELGVDLWPPAIILPVGEGRLGFADR